MINLKAVLVLIVVALLALSSYAQRRDLRRDEERQTSSLAGIVFQDTPEQFETSQAPFSFKGHTITPLAQFHIRARVLSREDYAIGAEAAISPMDLALGWNRMADPNVYEALNIRQSGRWYRYAWESQPPIPPEEIAASSANMHMIPADESVEAVLKQAGKGKTISIKGLLILATTDSGRFWRSSLSRTDTGAGACEVVYVLAAKVD